MKRKTRFLAGGAAALASDCQYFGGRAMPAADCAEAIGATDAYLCELGGVSTGWWGGRVSPDLAGDAIVAGWRG